MHFETISQNNALHVLTRGRFLQKNDPHYFLPAPITANYNENARLYKCGTKNVFKLFCMTVKID